MSLSKGVVIKNRKDRKRFQILDGYKEDLSSTDKNFVHVWVDGGGNCGPVSVGIVVVEKGIIFQTHGEYLGDHRTNNIAELTAILRGLQLVKRRGIPVKLYSDSSYALKSICGVFNGRKNKKLINKIVNYINSYPVEIIFVKVKGHTKIEYNELADSIASWFLQHVKELRKEGFYSNDKKSNINDGP